MKQIRKFSRRLSVLRVHRVGWILGRLWYEFQRRSGLFERRFPRRAWTKDELSRWLEPDVPSDQDGYFRYWHSHRPPFFFSAEDRARYSELLKQIQGRKGLDLVVEEAESIKEGVVGYFFAVRGALGWPPDWHLNPFTGQRSAPSVHWSRIPVYSSESGGFKFYGESGRFAFAFALARAYWALGDESYPEAFWQWVESWRASNPPNHGAQWASGQVISLRLMAWCFALYTFADSPATTPQRLAKLVGMIGAQADVVSRNHNYAKLQANNHAISEGVGLWTIGLLFPELRQAARWRTQGREILEREARRQIARDGSYIQDSVNYHRLMLHDYLWAIRLGQMNEQELSTELCQRVDRAVHLLYQLHDEDTGSAPNYGGNDGALILPLNTCDYLDFRPVLTAGHYLFHSFRLYPNGPWDEDLLWLFGPKALAAPQRDVPLTNLSAHDGGYYTLRGREGFAFVRCTTHDHRPGHADMLHLDLTWRDINVVCDPGSYLYFSDFPWNNSLASTQFHNTVTVDGRDQMDRGPRFMWLNWTKSRLRHNLASEKGLLQYFEGEHYGYHRLPYPVTHRRAVLRVADEGWFVIDDLIGEGEHDFYLHWLMPDLPYVLDASQKQVNLETSSGDYSLRMYVVMPADADVLFELVRGTEETAPRGWQSPSYSVREPALSASLTMRAPTPCRFISVLAPRDDKRLVETSSSHINWQSLASQLTASLLPIQSPAIIGQTFLTCHDKIDQMIMAQ